MEAVLVLCDWAEVVNQKIYAQGMGWSQIVADQPTVFAIAALIQVPYDQTNRRHHVLISLMTEDGAAYPTEQGASVEFDFEVGRPPGLQHGQNQPLPFAAKLNGIAFAQGGYRWEVVIDNEPATSTSFRAT
jgi:hypothetical protein